VEIRAWGASVSSLPRSTWINSEESLQKSSFCCPAVFLRAELRTSGRGFAIFHLGGIFRPFAKVACLPWKAACFIVPDHAWLTESS